VIDTREWEGRIWEGDCLEFMRGLPDGCVGQVVASWPYHVGQEYELGRTQEDWKALLAGFLEQAFRIQKPGGFCCVNAADIRCWPDESLPRLRFRSPNLRGHAPTEERVRALRKHHPEWAEDHLAKALGCSNQTVARRLRGNNARGAKAEPQTVIYPITPLATRLAGRAGYALYDLRTWWKDPTWATSRWHSCSYRAVDESEYIFVWWKPGPTDYERERLSSGEWGEWGSRAVWPIPSVRRNEGHPAQFPEELARRIIALWSSPSDLVLDPFLGSGTTAVVCERLKRRWIGCEINPEYVAMAQKRIDRERDKLQFDFEGREDGSLPRGSR